MYGSWKPATIETDDTSSAEVDLGNDYDYLEIIIPTLISGTIKIQVAEQSGGTFYDLGDGVTTATGTHNYADVFKLGGYRYIKVVSSVTQTTSDRLIRVRGMRY